MTLASVCAALPPGEAGSESGLSLAGPPPPPRTDPVPRGPPAETAVCRPGVYWELCLFPAFPSSGGWEQPGPGGRPRGGSYWPAAPWGSPSAQPARPPALRAPPPPAGRASRVAAIKGVPGHGTRAPPTRPAYRAALSGNPRLVGRQECALRESGPPGSAAPALLPLGPGAVAQKALLGGGAASPASGVPLVAPCACHMVWGL